MCRGARLEAERAVMRRQRTDDLRCATGFSDLPSEIVAFVGRAACEGAFSVANLQTMTALSSTCLRARHALSSTCVEQRGAFGALIECGAPASGTSTLTLCFRSLDDKHAIAAAAARGALPLLEKLWLDGNNIGDAGVQALAESSIGTLKCLGLTRNAFSRDVLVSLAERLSAGALLSLAELHIGLGSGRCCPCEQALVAACRQRGVGVW
jgi:hypothetical protein